MWLDVFPPAVSAVCGISIMQAYELSYEDKREGWVFFFFALNTVFSEGSLSKL